MGRRGRPPEKQNRFPKACPVRTREHVLADLSVVHFQWIAANCGYVTERPDHDYGYDLISITYNDAGEIESGSVLFQFKGTDDLGNYVMKDGETISFAIERQHVELWRDEPMPVILVIYDAQLERAFWLYAQRYFQSAAFSMSGDQADVSVHIPMQNVVNKAAIQEFRGYKSEALRLISEVPLHA